VAYNPTPNKKEKHIMQVHTTTNEGRTVTYGYSPEHYPEVNLFYAQALADGQITAYTIEREEPTQ
jgi:hypothetical protein